MKKLFSKLNYFIFLILLFALPVKDNILPTILTAWVATWLFEGNLKQKFQNFDYKNPNYLVLAIYFLIMVISVLQARDMTKGWYHVQQTLSIAFLPIIIAGSNQYVNKNYQNILLTFVIANLTISIFLLAKALYTNLHYDSGNWMFNFSPYKSLE
ncbi:MAG: hypothetical protein L3J74_12545, partial [Bacteroidales bacterium]|nr:hypothetical protein [Bacteroidales bacterium]